jgi:uncharacterized glyoxalase superfamily protein PhnB
MSITKITPVLRVKDGRASERFYCELLGFTKDWEHRFTDDSPLMLSVSSGAYTIHLSEHPGTGCDNCDLYLNVDEIDSFYNQQLGAGLAFEKAPTDEPWGMRELTLRDPDNHRITLGAQKPA